MLPPSRPPHRGRSQHNGQVHNATESACFDILKRCQSGFGNVGIASVAVAPVAAALVAAECIPQCFAVAH